jgi:acyl-CoA reductase-like NAD-dependent aldehyde dehydrogenase
MRDGLFIAGAWRKPAEDGFIEVFNPYTERVLDKVSAGGREDVAQAVSAARSALPGWNSAGGLARARFLRAVAQELGARSEVLEREEEAVALANDTEFGLVATVVSEDHERAGRVADAIEAGLVWINSPQTIFVETSLGGFKASGIGRELGPWGLSAYLGVKHVTQWVGGDGRP